MARLVAFLRAINVGGRAVVRMSDVCDAFVAAGCRDVRTYIQSGNVMFESSARDTDPIVQEVRRRLRDAIGSEPEILIRTAREMQAIVAQDPFAEVVAGPRVKLYVAFLSGRPRRRPELPLVSTTEALEVVEVSGREAFIVCRRKMNGLFGFPNNFIENELGVPATTRNWTTVTKIAALERTG